MLSVPRGERRCKSNREVGIQVFQSSNLSSLDLSSFLSLLIRFRLEKSNEVENVGPEGASWCDPIDSLDQTRIRGWDA